MRKIGGLIAVAALALAGCAAPEPTVQTTPQPTATTKWVTKEGQPFDITTVKFNDREVPAFKAAAAGIPAYSHESEASLTAIGHDLCEHYASGFTTEDLRKSGGESLATVGEAAKATVCATP
jgi:hypothetical protein